MKARCCICDEEIDLSVDEFIQIEDEIDDYICEECGNICIERAPAWWKETQLHLN